MKQYTLSPMRGLTLTLTLSLEGVLEGEGMPRRLPSLHGGSPLPAYPPAEGWGEGELSGNPDALEWCQGLTLSLNRVPSPHPSPPLGERVSKGRVRGIVFRSQW